MADETIRIVVDDESSKDNKSLAREIVSQADTGPQPPTVDTAKDREPPDTTDFEVDVSSLDAVLEEYRTQQEKVLQDLIGTTESIAAAGTDIEGFREEVGEASEALGILADEVGDKELTEELDTLNAAFGEIGESSEELADGWDDLISAMDRVENEWDRVADELKSTTEVAQKAGLQTARQTANLARAAGLIGSNANQIVAAGTALAKGLSSPAKAAVVFAVAVGATVLAIKSLGKAADNLAKEIGGFSADVAVASAERRILQIEDRIRLANERGATVADFVGATSELQSELREFKRDILGLILPLLIGITKILKEIVGLWNNTFGVIIGFLGDIVSFAGAGVKLLNPLEHLQIIVDLLRRWFGDNDPKVSNIHEDILNIFEPKNVGFNRDKQGNVTGLEKGLQKKFDNFFTPPES